MVPPHSMQTLDMGNRETNQSILSTGGLCNLDNWPQHSKYVMHAKTCIGNVWPNNWQQRKPSSADAHQTAEDRPICEDEMNDGEEIMRERCKGTIGQGLKIQTETVLHVMIYFSLAE